MSLNDLHEPATGTTTTQSLASNTGPNDASTTHENPSNVQVQAIQAPADSQQAAGYWEWIAHVLVNKHAVGGSFYVAFYLGKVPHHPAQSRWRASPNFAGSYEAFVGSSFKGQRDHKIQGCVYLNDGIARLSGLPSSQPNVVEPYLTDNLRWCLIDNSTGEAVDISEVPSLEIVVIASRLTLPPGGMFPELSETYHYHGITFGRPGGSCSAECTCVL